MKNIVEQFDTENVVDVSIHNVGDCQGKFSITKFSLASISFLSSLSVRCLNFVASLYMEKRFGKLY